MILWIAILLLTDAGFALLSEHRIRSMLPRWNIKSVAFIEAGIALILVAIHFGRRLF